MVMLIAEKNAIDGAKVLRSIGTVKATSAWHARGRAPLATDWRERMLRELVHRGEDVDADAIIDVDFVIDAVSRQDETGVALERMCATGIAVRLSNATAMGFRG
jgi:uncharacterized protein YbjQ (UPF0145 family)